MKLIVLVLLMLQLSTTLLASGTFEKYLSMKKEAYSSYESGNSKNAYELVNKFIKKYPKDVRAKNLLAVLYYWNGDLSKSKSILLSILERENFTQAATLLKRIEKKEGKRAVRVTTNSKKIKNKKSSKKSSTTADVTFLLDSIKRNPNDIISRKILAKYYKKIGKNSEVQRLASEVLRLDPDDADMLVLLDDQKIQSPKIAKQVVEKSDKRTHKAIAKLNYFYKYEKYNRFINLYNSLENNSVIMPTSIHVKALYCALNLGDYKKAKTILYIYRMPKNENIKKVEELIERKLAQGSY